MQVKLPKLGLIVYSIAAACSSQFYGTHFNFTCVFHFTYRKGFDRHREWVYHKTTTTKAKIDIYSETSQLTLYCFTYNWHNTFTINVSSLITSILFMFYEFTVHKKCSKFPSSELIAAWTRRIVDCRTLSRELSSLQKVWQREKLSWWNVCSFLTGSEYTVAFDCPHTQKSEGLESSEIGGCTSNNNCWRAYIDMGVFPCYVVGNSLMKFV